jgi:hypothetical protein
VGRYGTVPLANIARGKGKAWTIQAGLVVELRGETPQEGKWRVRWLATEAATEAVEMTVEAHSLPASNRENWRLP